MPSVRQSNLKALQMLVGEAGTYGTVGVYHLGVSDWETAWCDKEGSGQLCDHFPSELSFFNYKMKDPRTHYQSAYPHELKYEEDTHISSYIPKSQTQMAQNGSPQTFSVHSPFSVSDVFMVLQAEGNTPKSLD